MGKAVGGVMQTCQRETLGLVVLGQHVPVVGKAAACNETFLPGYSVPEHL